MAKLSMRPVSSHFLKMAGMVTVRFVSMRGAQNPSVSLQGLPGELERRQRGPAEIRVKPPNLLDRPGSKSLT